MTTGLGTGGVQDSTWDLETWDEYCRWYWSDNVGGSRGGRRRSRRFNGVLQGGKFDDHVIFKVPTFLYNFNHG